MDQFHALTIADLRRETPSATSIALAVPEALKEFYSFDAGQYLTFRAVINRQEIRRSYSVCVAPHENELRVAVKHLPGGVFSTHVNEALKIGDVLDVGKPEGRFCGDFTGDVPRAYAAFAAGSGITPVMSLIKTALSAPGGHHFTLFYGNRGSVDIMFLDELATLKDIYTDRLSIYHVLSREEDEFPILHGRFDTAKIKELMATFVPEPAVIDQYFVCGPEAMMDAVEGVLIEQGIDKSIITLERFGTTLSTADKERMAAHAVKAAGTMMEVTQGGRKVQVPFKPEAGNVLDAIRLAGLPAPFSCKGGVCATCRAKITEGTVDMAVHYGLTDDEIARGHILTCQAVPTSDKIALTYDV